MSHHLKELAPDQAIEAALKELNDVAALQPHSSESHKLNYLRGFKCSSQDSRIRIVEHAASRLKTHYDNEKHLEGTIWLVAAGLAHERDWDTSLSFLRSLLQISQDADFYREVAMAMLHLSDMELSDGKGKNSIGQAVLVLVTEFGLMIAERAGQSGLDPQGAARVVEYVTTSLLARSNLNNNAIRVSLLHYLAKCPLNSSTTSQLNRVISRFGQSLLDDLLNAFFEQKKRGNAAFFFLAEHLSSFFSAAPALAEMSHGVLRHYMLKHPDEFPGFMASYSEWVSKEHQSLSMTAQHIALLIKAATDVSQKQLAENLCVVLQKHLKLFAEVSREILQDEILTIESILRGNKPMKNQITEDIIFNIQSLLVDNSKKQGRVVPLAKLKKLKENIKPAKVGNKPSPLETMLALAS
ncbi:MAG: hypothetical protein RI953_3061 [Pseudomonadota bacterium]|jgi:hypothetical protein